MLGWPAASTTQSPAAGSQSAEGQGCGKDRAGQTMPQMLRYNSSYCSQPSIWLYNFMQLSPARPPAHPPTHPPTTLQVWVQCRWK
jgi:hypothetical protein